MYGFLGLPHLTYLRLLFINMNKRLEIPEPVIKYIGNTFFCIVEKDYLITLLLKAQENIDQCA